jgi:hypothetical protein
MKKYRPIIFIIIFIALIDGLYVFNMIRTSSVRESSRITHLADSILQKSYSEAKKELYKDGWAVYAPEDFKSRGDKEFPEIGNCGNGIDAVCTVSFRKENITDHIYVQI